MRRALSLVAALMICALVQASPPPVEAANGMVVSAQHYASEAGAPF